ncbi:hypothetical protein PR048_014433 [Dryococelus australis]|uniref:Uncharacterized protein n=1 Tax=Dryococelus australis TaxID=614101 RepID=A0ABQ9HEL4_9NEOP|nr:hypothetical protein PR048_014433 [Dryococelus australis]
MIVNDVTSAVIKAVIRELKETLSFDVERTTKLRGEVQQLVERLNEAKRQLALARDELEQYQRRSNLRFFGIPESENENADALVIDVIHKNLNLPHRTVDDINRSHRVGVKKTDKHRPIIVKFVSYCRRAKFSEPNDC